MRHVTISGGKFKPFTFEQEIQIRKFYELKNERARKRRNRFFKEVGKSLSKITEWFWILIKLSVIIFISVMAGQASEPVVYALNKPLGLGSAHFASYAISGLSMVILLNSIFNNKKEKA